MSYLRYLCLPFVHSGVQHIVCCVFVVFVFVLCALCCQFLWIVHFRYSLTCILRPVCLMLPVSLDRPFSVFSNVYSSSCVPYVASFSGSSIFGIL